MGSHALQYIAQEKIMKWLKVENNAIESSPFLIYRNTEVKKPYFELYEINFKNEATFLGEFSTELEAKHYAERTQRCYGRGF